MENTKARAKRLWNNYGTTVEEWDRVDEFQGRVCWLCKRPERTGKRLSTDHSHLDGLGTGRWAPPRISRGSPSRWPRDSAITDACERMMATHYDVSVANSGAEALELCRSSEPFAVVISDDDMPEMTGRELLNKVCQEFPHTVRVMLTGRKDLDIAVDAIEKGQIFRFLTKPSYLVPQLP